MKIKQMELEQICAKCEHSRLIFDPDNVLCELNGIVDAAYCCRKFVYDPLKRIPPKTLKVEPLEYIDIESDEE